MRRVLLLVTQLERAGAQKVALALAADREERGDRVTFAYFYDKRCGTAGWLDGRPFEVLDLRARVPEGWRAVNLLRTLAGLLRLLVRMLRGRYDAVVTFTRYSNLLGIPLAWLCRVPVRLASQHDLMSDAPGWLLWLDAALVNLGITTRMVACSEGVREVCTGTEGMDPERVALVPNWIEPLPRGDREAARQALREELGLPEGARLLLSLGRLSPEKGHDVLLEAAPRVLEEFPEAVFLLAGEGPRRDALEARAAELEIPGALRFLGSRDDVPRLLDAAELFLHPSRREGLPMALLEAAHHELPIVATRAEGIGEVVRDGETGRAVPIDDPAAFAAAVRDLLRDPTEAGSLASRALVHVAERFRSERSLEAWSRLIGGGTG